MNFYIPVIHYTMKNSVSVQRTTCDGKG